MTAVLATTLLALAILDGAFAGFRSSAGRTGLISHRLYDRRAARRGAGLASILLIPAVAVASADVILRPGHLADYTRAGTAMLAVYGPYALLVLAALACYATLNWQLRYLASALVLGPFTLFRPGIGHRSTHSRAARRPALVHAKPAPDQPAKPSAPRLPGQFTHIARRQRS